MNMAVCSVGSLSPVTQMSFFFSLWLWKRVKKEKELWKKCDDYFRFSLLPFPVANVWFQIERVEEGISESWERILIGVQEDLFTDQCSHVLRWVSALVEPKWNKSINKKTSTHLLLSLCLSVLVTKKQSVVINTTLVNYSHCCIIMPLNVHRCKDHTALLLIHNMF